MSTDREVGTPQSVTTVPDLLTLVSPASVMVEAHRGGVLAVPALAVARHCAIFIFYFFILNRTLHAGNAP